MNLLHKEIGFEMKAVSDEGVVEGYASVFGGAPDSYGDIIAPGAFADSLAEHRRKGTAPLMFFGHRASDLTIGNWTELAEDGKGLKVVGELDMDDPFAVKVHRKLKRKEMRGLSIGYETKDTDKDPKRPGVRILKAVDLWEVSIVNFPAQPRAAVDNVKSYTSAGHLPSLPEFEAYLREAGFSKSQATAIASKGLAHLLRSESGNAPDPVELARKLREALG